MSRRHPGWIALAGFLALSLLVSIVGGSVTATSVEGWYRTIERPPYNPPDWVFGPVWTLLYVMMAVAAWRVWRCGPAPAVGRALMLYGMQLALNLAWSLIFFGAHAIGAAFLEILVLLAAIAATTLAFWQIDRAAGWLMAPYLTWTAFAAFLNGSIWWLNS